MPCLFVDNLLMRHVTQRMSSEFLCAAQDIELFCMTSSSSKPQHGSHGCVVTHALFHASMLRPVSQTGTMHESAGVGKLVNAALL